MGYYDQILNSTITGAGAGASVGGVWGGLVGGGLGLMSGLAEGDPAENQIRQQQRLNELQITGNKELANYSQNLQKDMWNYTNYENQIKHLKAAGLNPALMYAKGGIGGQTGSANAGQVSGSHASTEAEREAIGIQRNAQMLQTAMNYSQIQNIKADTKVKEAEAEKIRGVDTEYTKSQTDVNIANIKLIGENTENTRLRNLGQETQNELLKLEKLYQEGTLDARILNQSLVNNNLAANIRKLNEEIPWIGKLAQGQLNVYEADVKVKTSQNRLNNANAADKEFYNDDYQRKLRTDKQELENKNIYQQNREISLKGDALQLKNEFLKNYGFSPDSSMSGLIAGMIARYSDEKGNLVEGWKTELIRELKQLVTDFSKMQDKISSGKFPWE